MADIWILRLKHFALFMGLLLSTAAALANSGITYQGRILKPDGTPLSGATTQFKLQIRTPDANNCLMYEEVQSLDLRNSNGAFALTINDGTGSRTDSSGFNLDRIFANVTAPSLAAAFTFDPTTCSSGSTYTPNSSDGRSLVVLFKDETMVAWEPMPASKINFVPLAFEAKQVQGFQSAALVRVQDPSGTMGNISPLSNANYVELLAIINGTTAQYEKAGKIGGVTVPSMTSGNVLGWNGTAWTSVDPLSGVQTFAKTTLPTCGAGQFLKDNGAGLLICAAPAGGGTVTQVDTGTGLTGGGFTTTGTISIAAGGVGTAELAAGGVTTAKIADGAVTTLKMADGAVATLKIADGAVTLLKLAADSVDSSKIVDGSITGADLDPAINVTTSGTVVTGVLTTRDFKLYPAGASTKKISFATDPTLASDYTLTLPLTAGGVGQVLTTNGSGTLTWTTPAGTGISALTSDVSASGSGSVAATVNSVGGSTAALVHTAELAANAATAANTASKIVARDASGNFTAGAISASGLAATGAVTSVTVTTSGNIVSGGSVTGNSVILKDSGANTITVSAPTTVTTSYVLKLPTAVATVANQVLASDTSGQTSWFTLPTIPTALPPNGAAGGDLSGTYPNPTVATVGTSTAALLHTAELAANAATSANTASTIVARDASGNFNAGSGLFAGNIGIGTTAPGVKLDVVGTIRMGDGGETCSGGNFAGSVRYNTGNIQFCNGTTWSTLGVAGAGLTALTGDVTASGTGSVSATVAAVGGVTAANVAAGANLANAATNANTSSTIVKRDASGNFTAGAVSVSSLASTGAVTAGSVVLKDTGSNTVTISAPTTVTGSYTLKMPTAVSGSTQLLQTDNTGQLSYIAMPTSMAPSGAAGGDLSGTYPNPTVATVGASTAANIHTAELAANGAVSTNTNSKIIVRDGTGNFASNVATFNGVSLNNAGSVLNITNPVGGAWSMILPATAGSSGQVMKTDGAGTMTWMTPLSSSTGYIQGGNAFGAIATLGTTDSYKLQLQTAGTARMTFDTSGNVGIGVAAPAATLDVKGTARVYNPSTNTSLSVGRLGDSPYYNSFNIYSAYNATYPTWSFGQSGAGNTLTYADYNLQFVDNTAGTNLVRMIITNFGNVGLGTVSPGSPLSVEGGISAGSYSTTTAPTNGMIISGNVGIGTTAPSSALELSAQSPELTVTAAGPFGGTGADIVVQTMAGSSNANPMGTYLFDLGSQTEWFSGRPAASASDKFIIGRATPAAHNQSTSALANSLFTILPSGNVGIGTTAPAYKLDVAGDVNITGNFKVNGTNLSSGGSSNGTSGAVQLSNGTGGFTSDTNLNYAPGYLAVDDGAGGTAALSAPGGSSFVLSAATAGGVIRLGRTSAAVLGDSLGAISFYDSTVGRSSSALIGAVASQAHSSGNTGGDLAFSTTPNGGTAYTERMRIQNSGNVGIGTTAPGQKLEVNGSVLATAYLYTSDRRLKKNFEPLDHSLEKLMSLNTVKFNWIMPKNEDEKRTQIGLIAQDVQKVFPEAVKQDEQGWLRLNYTALISPIIDSVRTLYNRITGVEAKQAKLEQQVAELKAKNDELELRLKRIEQALDRKPAGKAVKQPASK